MLLQDTIYPNGVIGRAATPPMTPESLPDLVAGMAIPAVVVVVLVVALLVLARKARQGLHAEPIQERGGATAAALLLALAEKERQLAGVVAPAAPRRHVPTPQGGTVVEAEGAAGQRAPSVYRGPVHCPACATQLGVSGPALQYVTRCPACARWIASRIEGQRVIVEARLV